MERICEFCAGLRPIIYCKPDAAHLCLSCDAKVHSANALSSRHLRTLLCDLCGNFPTYLQCLDHQMFLCRNCDRHLHDASSQHQKRTIRGYMGCPSARDFAALWGFEVNELDDFSQDQFASSCGSETSSVTTLDIPGQNFSHMVGVAKESYSPHVSAPDHKVGSLTRRSKMLYKCQEQSSSFILQQILDLRRLQLIKENDHSPLIRGEGKDGTSSSTPHTLEKLDETLNQHERHSKELVTDVQQRDNLLQELKMNPLPISFSQLENSPLSSAIMLPLHGESLWQCKSPAESSQLWSQNMEDLGVCDELICHDDFNIPEVDLTFQNIEDIFDGDEDPTTGLLDIKDESYSSMDKDMLLDKSDRCHGKGMEASSVTSSTHFVRSAFTDNDMDHSDHVCYPRTRTEPSRPIRPSSSTLSFSDSKLSIYSAHSDCIDKMGGEPSCSSPCHQENKHFVGNNDIMMRRNKEKKQSQLQDKQIRPSYRKARSLVRKRVKGRYAKPDQFDSDTIAVSRSY